jgi:sulfatase maturation enzyme AslB (radical SAM superfamily)
MTGEMRSGHVKSGRKNLVISDNFIITVNGHVQKCKREEGEEDHRVGFLLVSSASCLTLIG